MKSKFYFKKYISISIIASLLFVTVLCSKAFAFSERYLISSSDKCFLCSKTSNSLSLESVYPSTYTLNINTENYLSGFQLVGNNVYLFCTDDNSTEVLKYSLDGNCVDTLIISENILVDDFLIATDSNSRVYFSQPSDNKKVICLDFAGNIIDIYELDSEVKQILYLKTNRMLAFTVNGAYELKSGNPVFLSSIYEYEFFYNLNNEYIIEECGKIFDTRDFTYIASINMEISPPSAYIYDNYLFSVNSKNIYGYSLNNSNDLIYSLNDNAYGICGINEKIFVLSSSGITMLTTDSFTQIEQDNSQNIDEATTPNEPSNGEYYINSSSYFIDLNKNLIRKVMPNTSITAFKENIETNFPNFLIYSKDGSLKTRGKIGTDMSAKFLGTYGEIELKVIVNGDITGEGSVNNTDKNKLISYLLGSDIIDGNSFIAADLYEDEILDLKDLLALSREIEK